MPTIVCPSTPVKDLPYTCSRIASNVFEVATFSGTVEMVRVSMSCDLVIYGELIIRVSTLHVTSSSAARIYNSERDSCGIDAKFDTLVPHNSSNIFEVMVQVEMALTNQ